MLNYSIGHDPLIYIEGDGLILVGNPFETHSLSFSRVWMSWDRVCTLLDSDWQKSEVPTGFWPCENRNFRQDDIFPRA
jgi:hypothetical protein